MHGAAQLEAALATAGVAPVSRETGERLTRFVALLAEWRKVTNLVGGTLDDVWTRHVGDSAQLLPLAPNALLWVDLGSGAGFPGMVLAILLAETPGAMVHLVESDRRKVAFLRAVRRETGAAATIHAERIEAFVARWEEPVEIVTARAVAALDVLCGWVEPLIRRGAWGLLMKGEGFRREFGNASLAWDVDLVEHSSRFGSGVIAEIRALRRRPSLKVP